MYPLLRRLLCCSLIALLGIAAVRSNTSVASLAPASSEQENDDDETTTEEAQVAPSLEVALLRGHRLGVSLRLLPVARLASLPRYPQPVQPLPRTPELPQLSRLQI
ncbi:MAG TPA: hypothetical protein VH877_30345 [Polyangia bacterium]|nr:hypothetical protein [Polyangia bacterium]